MSTCVGGNQTTICGCTDLNCTKVGYEFHVQFSSQRYVGSKPNWKMQPTDYVCVLIVEQGREKLHHNLKGSSNNGVHFS